MSEVFFLLLEVHLISRQDAFSPSDFLEPPQGQRGKRESRDEAHGLIAFTGQYILPNREYLLVFRQCQDTEDDFLGAWVVSGTLCERIRVQPQKNQMALSLWRGLYHDLRHLPCFSSQVTRKETLSETVLAGMVEPALRRVAREDPFHPFQFL